MENKLPCEMTKKELQERIKWAEDEIVGLQEMIKWAEGGISTSTLFKKALAKELKGRKKK